MPDFSYNAYRKALSRRPDKPPIGRCVFSIDCRVDAEFAGGGWRNVLVSVAEHIRDGERVGEYQYNRRVRLKGSEAINQGLSTAIETGDLPSRQEAGKIVGELAKDFMANPKAAIKEGFRREQAFREGYKLSTGRVPPDKKRAVLEGGRIAASKAANFLKDNSEEIVLNASGMAGAAIGGAATGGMGGQLAGDLVGTKVARKALTDISATKSAYAKLSTTDEYKSAGFVQRLQMMRKESIAELRRGQEESRVNAVGDVSGWAAGNAVEEVASRVGASVPFSGIVAGSLVSPKVQDAYTRMRRGESASRVVPQLGREIAGIPKEIIAAGNRRERELRSQIKAKILGTRSTTSDSVRSPTPPDSPR